MWTKEWFFELMHKYDCGELTTEQVWDYVDLHSSASNDGKQIVSRSVEFEKPQPTLSADEIKSTAEMLWKKPMKLEAVKMVMKLGYSLKDAKAYCELHFG